MKNGKTLARLTGVGYLVIFITGFYGNFYVLQGLVVPGDGAATAHNLLTHASTYRMGVFAFLAMVFVDLILAWPLFVLLKESMTKLALTSSLLRVINAGFFFAAWVYLFDILWMLPNGSLGPTQTMYVLDQFNRIWTWGLLVFGLHLLLLGRLLFRSVAFPQVLGLLIGMAGLGYLIDCTAQLLMSNYAVYQDLFEMVVIIPGILGEFSLTLWLLVKGVRDTSSLKNQTQGLRFQA
ncbi:MAG TPA: DUF4386 domain-containing protein [Cytophagales bacterium]|nr:DUF4386 domain-containing protein [Cytophagales bacterium]HAA17412.1 DUF4386 domain-containing protein [Cytophagales bacterium]HAP58563.1 DUF4386 domain-containing protein [Cytophagales bacterium]